MMLRTGFEFGTCTLGEEERRGRDGGSCNVKLDIFEGSETDRLRSV